MDPTKTCNQGLLMFQKGDLVWAYGAMGLILDTTDAVNSTDYLVIFFPQPHQYGPSWISEKYLNRYNNVSKR